MTEQACTVGLDVSKLESDRKNGQKNRTEKVTSGSDYYRYIGVESNSRLNYLDRF